jgi:hypothetical protein
MMSNPANHLSFFYARNAAKWKKFQSSFDKNFEVVTNYNLSVSSGKMPQAGRVNVAFFDIKARAAFRRGRRML